LKYYKATSDTMATGHVSVNNLLFIIYYLGLLINRNILFPTIAACPLLQLTNLDTVAVTLYSKWCVQPIKPPTCSTTLKALTLCFASQPANNNNTTTQSCKVAERTTIIEKYRYA